MQSNPYEAPGEMRAGDFVPATPVRPASVTVFGILNIVFGAMGICGAAFSAATWLVIPRNADLRNPVLELMAQSPAYRLFNQVGTALGFVAAIVLIVAGIGLLQTKPFGRTLSIGYSLYAILSALVGVIFSFVFLVKPLLEKAQAAGGGPEQAAAIGGMVGGALGGCIGTVYPILLLIFMCRRNVAEALHG